MNRNIAAALVAAAAISAPAFADDISYDTAAFTSTKTRAEVRANLAQARQAANPHARTYDPIAGFRSERSRDEVRAEYLANRDEVAVLNAEVADPKRVPAAVREGNATRVVAGQPRNAQ